MMRWISNSETKDLGNCERLWYYRHYLKLEADKPYSKPLAFGIYGHMWLEGYYKAIMTGASVKEAVTAGDMQIIPLMNDFTIGPDFATKLVKLMARYVNFYHDEDTNKYRILAVERVFKAPITSTFGIAIRLDVLKYGLNGYHKNEIILEDHKFTHNFWDSKVVLVATQLPKYMWTISNDPAIKDQIGNRKINKGYLNQIRYRDMQDHNEFFRRTPINPKDIRIENIMGEHSKLAEHASNLHDMDSEQIKKFISRRLDKDACEGCDFLVVCTSGLDGVDETEALQVGYRPNDYGYNN